MFGLLDGGGRMTLARLAEYPAGIYRVPSGGIEPGEAAIDALYREVAEEFGRTFEVLRYAGLIVFEIRGPGPAVRFPSYSFLLEEKARPGRAGGGPSGTDGEIDATVAAAPSELDSMIARLDSIQGPWADWGRYRAASGRLVAGEWEAWRAAAPGGEVSRRHQVVDASLPLHRQMACYPGDEPPGCDELASRSPGAAAPGWRVTRWTLSAHAGTHVDAPAHLLPGGITVDRLAPEVLSGPALVVDCRRALAAGRPVSRSDLPPRADLMSKVVLLKLGLGREIASGQYDPQVPVLDAGAARYLVQSGARAVGVDSLSIDSQDAGHAAHLVLFEGGLPVIEGLELSAVQPGEWWLDAQPLRLEGAEASPCRAVLWRKGQAPRPGAGGGRRAGR